MKLTRKQFDILTLMEGRPALLTQREIGGILGISLGTVNKTLAELSSVGLIQNGRISSAGLLALEPYRVKRAVFIAAGFGERLIPITLNTPKPLVRVNGKRIIDTLLDAVVAAGIEEIYIVRGYLAEQFDQLMYKYPTIKFIENPAYNEANNISSVMCARYLLRNAYLFEADLFLYNKDLITKYQYSSNYLGIPVDKTDDWFFEMKGDIITGLHVGGLKGCQMVGISYWTESDGARLADHVMDVYQSPGGKERFWDTVALHYHAKEYEVSVRPCRFEDIIEIDTFRELKQLDKSYDRS